MSYYTRNQNIWSSQRPCQKNKMQVIILESVKFASFFFCHNIFRFLITFCINFKHFGQRYDSQDILDMGLKYHERLYTTLECNKKILSLTFKDTFYSFCYLICHRHLYSDIFIKMVMACNKR